MAKREVAPHVAAAIQASMKVTTTQYAAQPALPHRSAGLAAHVLEAIGASKSDARNPAASQAAAAPSAAQSRGEVARAKFAPSLAPHVARAIRATSPVQRKVEIPTPVGQHAPAHPSLAAHVAAAIQASIAFGGPRSQPPIGPARAVVQRMERSELWDEASKEPLYHEPAMGPLTLAQERVLNDTQQEMHALSKKQAGKKRPPRPQEKETVKGNIGEFDAAFHFAANGISCVDANRTIQKNIAGIDHIIDHGSFCFSQSKVHISGDLKTMARAYELDIDKRFTMALKFAQAMLRGDSQNKIGSLKKANSTSLNNNKVLTSIIKDLEAAEEEDEFPQDNDDELVVQIGNAILFPVPRDIYGALSAQHQAVAIALQHDADWYEETLKLSHYMDKKPKRTHKVESDEDYEE